MDLVMFHSGELPKYIRYTFSQIRLFNPDLTIHFITDKKHIIEQPTLFHTFGVKVYNKDEYYSNKIEMLTKLMGRDHADFWMITMSRLVYIETFIGLHNLKNVFHFENDVLLYRSLSEMYDTFDKLYPSLAITQGSEHKWMTGFAFIKDYISLSKMTHFFIYVLQTYGIKGTIKKYGMDMVHEMSLMAAYHKEQPNRLAPLPTLPSSDNFNDFNSIFDSAAWGQFVGGTQNEGPGAKPTDHDVSRVLINNPTHSVIWKLDDKNRKVPYYKTEEDCIRINNLHMHSKNLHLYLS
jgi:hypothetical protein